ncbi:hypothetical protein GCM10023219_11430 [Stakelama sediminis]|uniref:Lipoprotein n=1 Tax=Stakelama sediminis TaxID=463200 RepID=A0A840YWD8_9SPHN|nr:hypothetical protein [Stakelama sediminis]MBB5717867.1 hypothetical protein [Stakelama sediminis]
MRSFWMVVPALALLAGCNSNEPGNGTSITIQSQDDSGNATIASVDGKTGKVSVKLPGFSGSLDLPKLHLDGSDVDIEGVHLYPGSKVTGVDVMAKDNPDKGGAKIAFDSPASVDIVRQWFRGKFQNSGFSVNAAGQGLSGTTKEGKAYTLDLSGDGGDSTKGVLSVSG